MDNNNKTLEAIFVEAVKAGNLDKVRSCINLGINVNICDDGGLHLIRNVEKICHLVNVNTPCIHKYSDVDNFYTVFWLQ